MTTPTFRAIDNHGRTLDDPSGDQVHDMLADMSVDCFVIVERRDREPVDEHYIQVYLRDDLSYQVEYRDGGAGRHFQALVPRQREVVGVQPVADLIGEWMADRPGWREALPWVPLKL